MVAKWVVFQLTANVRIKGGNHCGAGCKCLRCCNLPENTSLDMENIEVDETEDRDSDSDGDLEKEVDDIIIDIGGHDSVAEQSDQEPDSNSDVTFSDGSMDIELDR